MRVPFHRFLFHTKKKSKLTTPVEELTGLPISNDSLFHQAFTHSGKPTENYQRLEFLGDAILDAVVSEWLFKKFPGKKEGRMTVLRSRFVSRDALVLFAKEMNLQSFIQSDTLDFSTIDESNERVLGDVLEALIGAIYLTKGYESTQYFIEKKLLSNDSIVSKIRRETRNYKGLLLEKSQQNHFNVRFEFDPYDGQFYLASVFVDGVKLAYGRGKTKKKAEQNAAKYIIDHPGLLNLSQQSQEEE